MKIYNTLSGKKEEFNSINKDKITMYACGITPYDDAHLGHGMQAVIFDTIRRYLEYKGYEVKYIRNYTDVDDKIIDRAKKQNIEPLSLSRKFIRRSNKDLKDLKVKQASLEPIVSEHINDIITFIEELVNKGYAYESSGSVYFAVLSFKEYGKLSHRSVEDLKAESNFVGDKKSPYDFALWKTTKKGEINWDSPWGKGRPGWHIECSTLSQKYLGNTIDIHGGGRDLIFPHHENEIAQSEARTGEKFSNYWIHNGLVTINKQKMSKSLGNFYTIRDLLDKYTADLVRFLIFSFSYSANLNFEERDLLVIDKRLYGFYNTINKLNKLSKPLSDDLTKLNNAKDIFVKNFTLYMDDNFSTPRVIAELNKFFTVLQPLVLKYLNNEEVDEEKTIKKLVKETLKPVWEVLDILNEEPNKYIKEVQNKILIRLNLDREKVENIIALRFKAKQNKDFALSDKYRDELLNLGIEILDNPDKSTSWFQKI